MKIILLGSMLALSLASLGHATPDMVMNPVADNGFQYGLSDNNYGTSSGLFIREYWKSDGTGNNRQFFAYIRFDPSSVTNPIKAVKGSDRNGR